MIETPGHIFCKATSFALLSIVLLATSGASKAEVAYTGNAVFTQLRESILKEDDGLYPDQSALHKDIPALIREMGTWLVSDPEFKEEKFRVRAYKVLSNKAVASNPDAAELLLGGLQEPSEYIRLVCLLGTKWAPASMRESVRAAQDKALADHTISGARKQFLTRELGLESKPIPFTPASPLEAEMWQALSATKLNREEIHRIAEAHGADEIAGHIEALLNREPSVLGEEDRLHAYAALGLPALMNSPVSLRLLGAGLLLNEPKVQVICARALGSALIRNEDEVLAAYTVYLQGKTPNKDVDLLIFEKLLSGKFVVTEEMAAAAASHISLFATDKNHPAYCAFVILAGLDTARAISIFKQTRDTDVIRGIATGIALEPGRVPRALGAPVLDYAALHRYTLSLIQAENPTIREAGLKAIWGSLGADAYTRTAAQAAINKQFIEAAKRIKALENTPEAEKGIRMIEVAFDDAGFLKSDREIREALSKPVQTN